jgi:predicted anti-sigma-YlaC factor YlaD
MNHQPFKNWLFEDHPLTREQEDALQVHLTACPDCRQLQQGWQAARVHIEMASTPSPRPDFAQRWQNSLPERRARRLRQQVRQFGFGLAGLLLLSLSVLAMTVLANTTPVAVLISVANTIVQLISNLNEVQSTVRVFLTLTPPLISILIIALVAGWVSVLSLAWTFIVYRITVKGVQTK